MLSKKYAVVTLLDDSLYQYFEPVIFKNFKKYCEKIDSDLYVYGSSESENFHLWKKTNNIFYLFKWSVEGKLTFIKNLLKIYERVLYIDSDFLINVKIAPNIFDIVNKDSIGIYNGIRDYADIQRTTLLTKQYYDIYNKISLKYNKPLINFEDWDKTYYNNGMYVVSRGHENALEEPDEYITSPWYLQDYFNYTTRRSKIKVQLLGIEWNSSIRDYPTISSHNPENMKKWEPPKDIYNTIHYFLHFLGIRASNYEERCKIMNDYAENLIKLGSM